MITPPNPPAARLAPIEGLRAYLALWVLFSHAMQWSDFAQQDRGDVWAWAGMGFLSVKIFMIISGFVIFHRLDAKRETARVFLLHRFFRLYPLYIVVLLACLPVNAAALWQNLPAAAQIGQLEPAYHDWMAAPGLNVLLHVFLLHGLPPDSLVPGSAYAFLPPAWSVTLEFQFYLLAPLVFFLATRASGFARGALYGLTLLFLVIANRQLYAVLGALSLPYFWSYFLTGVLSFYAYRRWRGQLGWPVVAGVALILFKVSNQSTGLFPICAWLLFFGLLVDAPTATAARLLLPFFNHAIPQYLGRISYSIYLTHWPVLALLHLGFARLGVTTQGGRYFVILGGSTLVVTLAVSAVLYHLVEKPGIVLGQRLAARLFPSPALPPALVKAVS